MYNRKYRQQGFVLFAVLSSILFMLSIVTAISTEAFKESLKRSRQTAQKEAFAELLRAYNAYLQDQYSRLQQAAAVTSAKIFPEKLSDLVDKGYLQNPDFRVCAGTSCEFSLYYRAAPIIYYRSPLAKADCNFIVGSDGSKVYSATALIVMQGPIMIAQGINSDAFYSSLQSAIENPSSTYLTPATIDSLYSTVATSPKYSDDMYAFISAPDLADELQQELEKKVVLYAQNLYTRFHEALSSQLESLSLDPALAVRMMLANKNVASSLCMAALAEALEVPKSQLDTSIYGASIGSCGGSSVFPTGIASLDTFSLYDLYKNYFCIRVYCVLVQPDEKTATKLIDVTTWPAVSTYSSLDIRVGQDFSVLSTTSSGNCPFREP